MSKKSLIIGLLLSIFTIGTVSAAECNREWMEGRKKELRAEHEQLEQKRKEFREHKEMCKKEHGDHRNQMGQPNKNMNKTHKTPPAQTTSPGML